MTTTTKLTEALKSLEIPVKESTHQYFDLSDRTKAEWFASQCGSPLFTTTIGNHKFLSFRSR